MDSKKYLLDFEVEAHACLKEELEKITSFHPDGEYEVHISNLSVNSGTDRPLLSVQIIIPGEDIEEVKEPGTTKLKEYLHYLTFATNMSFRIHKLIRIIDWTPGLKERRCLQFERFPGSELPYPLLEEELFRSIETLQKSNISTAFKRALKWFANGVSSEYLDDQFQYFWYVIELLAQIHKESGKVNDLCPKCRKPLYCEECETHPAHKPYPKQAIRQLIDKIVRDNPQEFFDVTNEIRNSLMHGDSIEEIEKARRIELSNIVDSLGSVAWVAILNTFRGSLNKDSEAERLNLLQTNMYSHQVLVVAAHLVVYSSNPDEPVLSEFARPELSLVYGDENEAET